MGLGLYDLTNDALLDAIGINGTTFAWKGVSYPCIVNADHASIVTAKSYFGNRGYPNRGDIIRIFGKNRQVKTVENSTSEFVEGGIVDISGPFVDDPTNPALSIVFEPFIYK